MSGICNEQGDFENIIFSYANIADCKIAEKLAEVVRGGNICGCRVFTEKRCFETNGRRWN